MCEKDTPLQKVSACRLTGRYDFNLRALVNVSLASTAEAKSGLSSTILRVRI
jgi:hypothetical protein